MIFERKIKPFIETFVHDLKNKLTAIKFSLSLLKNPHISEEDKKLLLDKAIVTTDKSVDMLSDFLELERYKNEKFLSSQKINFTQLIDEIIDELSLDIKAKKIEVKKIYPQEKIYIIANEKWLKKAILNILHNAVKYNKENGKVYIKIEPAKRGIVLMIKDTGIGLDEAEKQNIFKKFYTKGNGGSGIGLTMASAVIESLGGKIQIDSEKEIGTAFYIFLPKTAKSVKIKKLALALSSFILAAFFVYDYYFCVFSQKIVKEISDNNVIYKLQNGVTAVAGINDKIKIIAKRNLLATRFKTEFILKKSDIKIDTNSQPIKVVANGIKLKNHGTQFETVTDKKKFATSVYKGEIEAQKKEIKQNEGIIKSGNKLFVQDLPEKIKDIAVITEKTGNVKIYWESPYKKFRLMFSPSEKFDTKPLYEYYTKKRHFTVDDIPDGLWFVSVQNIKDSLYSVPSVKSFIYLKTYLKAKKAFNTGNFELALSLVNKSLKTIQNASYKPYLLKAQILNLYDEYGKAVEFALKAYKLNKNKKTAYVLSKTYFNQKKYKKALEILNAMPESPKKFKLEGLIYYNLNNYKKAKKYLFKVLETNPDDKETIRILLKIFKKEHNKFMIHVFENKLLKGKK